MKKKIVALILMLAIVSTFFVGCSLFETDADRDYHQVVANVSYTTEKSGTLTAVVYKGEVKTRVNMYAGYLMQYGLDAEGVVNYCYNDIAREKLLLLYAQEYLFDNKLIPAGFGFDNLTAWNKFKNKDTKNQIVAYSKFLTIDEYRYCIEVVNKQFNDSWEDLIEEREKELSKNEGDSDDDTENGDDEIDESDLLPARDQKDRTTEEDEDEEYEINESIKSEEDIVNYFAKKYDVALDASKITYAYFFNYANSLIKKETKDKQKIMKSTLNDLKKNIENQYADYEFFLVQQMQKYIVTKYTDHVKEIDKVVEKVTADYKNRYKDFIRTAIDAYKDDSSYESAVGDNTFVFAAPSKAYLQVKSILLSFSDEQENAISNIAQLNSSNENIEKLLRNYYATGIISEELKGISLDLVDVFAERGIKVNVSNPDYDPDEDKLIDAYTDASIKDKEDVYANPSVDYLTVLAAMANDIQAKVKKADTWAKENKMSPVEQYLIKQYASQEAFNDWINLVNDDPGMASTDVYAVTPNHKSTSYVEEYTVLARALTNAGVGAMAIKDYDNSDSAKVQQGSIDYTVNNETANTEILKGGNGAYTLYKQEITSYVDEDENNKDNKLSADVYTLVVEETGAEISFIVNQFGIHIVMVASLPIDEELGRIIDEESCCISEQTKEVENEDGEMEEKTFFVKDEGYLYDYSVKIEYEEDEDGNEDKSKIKSITVEKQTVKEYIEDLLKNEISSDVTTLQQLNLFGVDTHISKVDKIYKQIVKELKEALNK